MGCFQDVQYHYLLHHLVAALNNMGVAMATTLEIVTIITTEEI